MNQLQRSHSCYYLTKPQQKYGINEPKLIKKENIQSNLKLPKRLHNKSFNGDGNLQEQSKRLDELFLYLERINDASADAKKKELLRSLPKLFGFIALMAETQNMDFDSICAILKSEMECRKSYKFTSSLN